MNNFMKKSILLVCFVLTSVFFGCNSDNSSENNVNEVSENEVFINKTTNTLVSGEKIEVTDLGAFFSTHHPEFTTSSDPSSKCPKLLRAKVFPVNGCQSFTGTATVNLAIVSLSLETEFMVCCACGVCAPYASISTKNKTNSLNYEDRDIIGVTIDESSNISKINTLNYSISLKEGYYEVNNGEVKNMVYIIEVN